jgi:hypothetical protein
MELLKTGYTITPVNYSKPTPKWLKLVADIFLLLAGIMEVVPDFKYKTWFVFGGIALKLISKFITDETQQVQVVVTDEKTN